MKFLIDANLPPALARWLASEGHEAHHVSDFGLEAVPDKTIWAYARELDACVVTKDEDFILLQTSVEVRRSITRRSGPVQATKAWLRENGEKHCVSFLMLKAHHILRSSIRLFAATYKVHKAGGRSLVTRFVGQRSE